MRSCFARTTPSRFNASESLGDLTSRELRISSACGSRFWLIALTASSSRLKLTSLFVVCARAEVGKITTISSKKSAAFVGLTRYDSREDEKTQGRIGKKA